MLRVYFILGFFGFCASIAEAKCDYLKFEELEGSGVSCVSEYGRVLYRGMGVYEDVDGVKWMIKAGAGGYPVIASELLRLFLDDKRVSENVLVVTDDGSFMFGSKWVDGFVEKVNFDEGVEVDAISTLELEVVMAVLGLTDNHDQNVGGILMDGVMVSAVVDYDVCFSEDDEYSGRYALFDIYSAIESFLRQGGDRDAAAEVLNRIGGVSIEEVRRVFWRNYEKNYECGYYRGKNLYYPEEVSGIWMKYEDVISLVIKRLAVVADAHAQIQIIKV